MGRVNGGFLLVLYDRRLSFGVVGSERTRGSGGVDSSAVKWMIHRRLENNNEKSVGE